MKRLTLVIIGFVFFPSSASALSYTQVCDDIALRYSHDLSAYERVLKRVKTSLRVDCKNISNSRFSADLLGINGSSNVQTKIRHLRRHVENANGSMTIFTEAQALTDALDAYESLGSYEQAKHASDLIDWGLYHITYPEDMQSRLRFNNNFARLIQIMRQHASAEQKEIVRRYVEYHVVVQYPSEGNDSFAIRKQLALSLWQEYMILLYYWPETLLFDSGLSSDIQKHQDIITIVHNWAKNNTVPGMDNLSIIVIREDIGATAAIGTLWMSTHSSERTFIHELGHVLHFSKPEFRDSFDEFQRLFDQSSVNQDSPGDFMTNYHTNSMEDFAELYTEYFFGGTVGDSPTARASQMTSIGRPLLQKKLEYLLQNLY